MQLNVSYVFINLFSLMGAIKLSLKSGYKEICKKKKKKGLKIYK